MATPETTTHDDTRRSNQTTRLNTVKQARTIRHKTEQDATTNTQERLGPDTNNTEYQMCACVLPLWWRWHGRTIAPFPHPFDGLVK